MGQPIAIVGDKDIRSVYNGTGATISQGTLLALKSSPTKDFEVEAAATATANFLGVAMNDIPDTEYGDCQIRGCALALASTTVAAAARITGATGGKTVAASAGNSVFGVAVTAGTSDALHMIELLGPGGVEMPG